MAFFPWVFRFLSQRNEQETKMSKTKRDTAIQWKKHRETFSFSIITSCYGKKHYKTISMVLVSFLFLIFNSVGQDGDADGIPDAEDNCDDLRIDNPSKMLQYPEVGESWSIAQWVNPM